MSSSSSSSTPNRPRPAVPGTTSSLPRPSPRPRVIPSTSSSSTPSRLAPTSTSSRTPTASTPTRATATPTAKSTVPSTANRGLTPTRPRAPLTHGSTSASPAIGSSRATTTPVRSSIRDQIKAMRAAQATPIDKGSPSQGSRIKDLIKKSADTGRLIIPSSFSPPLQHLPLALYTLLLGIPLKELSRKPPKPSLSSIATSSPFSGSSLEQRLDRLNLDGSAGENEEDGFGKREEEEETGGFIASVDLETLKAANQELELLDLELGLFGGLKVLDFRHNRLTSIPTSFPNLGLLTSLNLSHNRFDSFPPHLTLLPNLVELDLSHNALSTLSFLMPPPSPIFPGTPPSSFQSPPDAGRRLDSPLPSLKVLSLAGNKLTLAALPDRNEDGWPSGIEVLNLGENPLVSPSNDGTLSLASFVALRKLKHLSLASVDVRSLTIPPMADEGLSRPPAFQRLVLVTLSANPHFITSDLGSDSSCLPNWVPQGKSVRLQLGETGEEGATPSLLHVVVDEHLLPKKTMARKTHVWIPPSFEEDEKPVVDQVGRQQTESESERVDDPFGLPTYAPVGNGRRSAMRGGASEPAPLSFDSPESLAPTTSSSLASRPSSSFASSSTSSRTSPSSPHSNSSPYASSPYASSPFYNPQTQSYTLSLSTRTPNPAFPTGKFCLQELHDQPFSAQLRSIALSGRSLTSIVIDDSLATPSSSSSSFTTLCFPNVTAFSITSTPSSIPSSLLSNLRTIFPALEELDLSEAINIGDLLAQETTVRKLILGGECGEEEWRTTKGLKRLLLRETGMRNLSGLEAIAKALKEGEPDVRERWRCEEIDLRDCAVEKLEPVLGYLPLKHFLVERNLFRAPHRRTWEQGGTAGLLAWLSDRA